MYVPPGPVDLSNQLMEAPCDQSLLSTSRVDDMKSFNLSHRSVIESDSSDYDSEEALDTLAELQEGGSSAGTAASFLSGCFIEDYKLQEDPAL